MMLIPQRQFHPHNHGPAPAPPGQHGGPHGAGQPTANGVALASAAAPSPAVHRESNHRPFDNHQGTIAAYTILTYWSLMFWNWVSSIFLFFWIPWNAQNLRWRGKCRLAFLWSQEGLKFQASWVINIFLIQHHLFCFSGTQSLLKECNWRMYL